jgi:antitoxin ParD1/3/4
MMQISLKPEQEKFIEDQLRSGAYRTPDEVISVALDLLESDPIDNLSVNELEDLRQAINVGAQEADRGDVAPWNVADVKAKVRQRLSSNPRPEAH